MDPLIATGNVFSLKGSQNHVISNQWKEAVSREERLLKGWKTKYAKQQLALEDSLLLDVQEKDKQEALRTTQPRPPSRQVLYEDGQGRLPFLKQQYKKDPHLRSSKPLTASQEIGWRASNQISQDMVKSQWGHKPIVTTSFFRKRGVF